jgi:hypothetical protein
MSRVKLRDTMLLPGTLSVCAALLIGASEKANAVDLITNGSFETGDLTGWVASDIGAPFYALAVRNAGTSPGFGLFVAAPTAGTWAVTHGFDGAGPGTIDISQDVNIPAGFSAELTFDWRAGWDFALGAPATIARTLDVIVEPSGGGTALQTTNILSAVPPPDTVLDNGQQAAVVDLGGFAGQAIRVKLSSFIPQNFTGPAHLQIDNVVLDIQPLDDDGDGVLNTADICPDTSIPEDVPTVELRVNRFALVDGDGSFDTTAPYGGGRGPMRAFSITDTAGCSCDQIISESGLGAGHTKFGCSIGAMEQWIGALRD